MEIYYLTINEVQRAGNDERLHFAELKFTSMCDLVTAINFCIASGYFNLKIETIYEPSDEEIRECLETES